MFPIYIYRRAVAGPSISGAGNIASGNVFGTAAVIGTQGITAIGIDSSEAFGTASGQSVVSPDGIVSAYMSGSGQMNRSINGTGIASAYTSGSATLSNFNVPQTFALTAFLRDYSGGSWNGTVSNGTSGSGNNDFTDPGNEPGVGSSLNGWGTADFNGTDDYLLGDGTLDTYSAATAVSGWCLFKPDSVSANQRIFDHSGSQLSIYITSTALIAIDGGGSGANRSISSGVWSLITWRYNGTNIQIGINEVPGASGGNSSQAASSSMTLTGSVNIGRRTNNTQFLDGTMAEFGMIDIALTDQNFTDLKSYVNSRYALSL